jgi:hypothetical protein
VTAFAKNTSIWRSIFYTSPVGWNRRVARKIRAVIENSGQFVQKLNDSFANPSGRNEIPELQQQPSLTEPAGLSTTTDIPGKA